MAGARAGGGKQESAFRAQSFSFTRGEASWGWQGLVHNHVNVLNATECALKMAKTHVLCYVHFTTIHTHTQKAKQRWNAHDLLEK